MIIITQCWPRPLMTCSLSHPFFQNGCMFRGYSSFPGRRINLFMREKNDLTMISNREETEHAKKKYTWTGLELRGPIKNLSPVLWSFTHLTSLYLNDNNLQRLPPDIVNLSNLSTLDLSGNKLRSLPSELGDMIQLRELLLNNNSLRILPCELGRLFLLQVLGVTGNPLSADILNMATEPQGTAKLLTFLLENLTGG